MITYVKGDLLRSPAKVLVNTVNTVGVMGKGIAYDFKRIYPEMFSQYQQFCENGLFKIGKLWLYKTPHKWILNFPTKRHWRNKSKVEYLEAGLEKFANTYDSKGIVSISFPQLGCGNGELDWKSQVQPLMEEYLRRLPIDIYIHHYEKTDNTNPEHRRVSEMKQWLRREPRFLPFEEFWDDVISLADSSQQFVTLDAQTRFAVSSSLFRENLLFEFDSRKIEAPKEVFEELWNQIRPSGYYAIDDFHFEPAISAQILASFLRHLDYVRPIEIANLREARKWHTGLLLSAQSTEQTSESHLVLSA